MFCKFIIKIRNYVSYVGKFWMLIVMYCDVYMYFFSYCLYYWKFFNKCVWVMNCNYFLLGIKGIICSGCKYINIISFIILCVKL